MTLAGRALFVIDRRGRLAHVDRSFSVPKSLGQTALLGVLEKLVEKEIQRAVGKPGSPGREVKVAFLRGLDAIARRDIEGLRRQLASPDRDPADFAGTLRVLPEPRPCVFDLVDATKITPGPEKEGRVEASALLRLPDCERVSMALRKTDAGYKLVSLHVE